MGVLPEREMDMDEVMKEILDGLINAAKVATIEKYKKVREELGDVRAMRGLFAETGAAILLSSQLPDNMMRAGLDTLVAHFVETTQIIDAVFPETTTGVWDEEAAS